MRLTEVTLLVLLSGFGIGGCDVNEGPAEEAGEQLDEAGDELEDATDDDGR
jgi:hypothetical protein